MEKLQELVSQIEAMQSSLDSVEEELHGLEASRLAEVVAIARKGLAFYRVVMSASYHNCNTCRHNPRKEYGEWKGILVAEKDNSEYGDIRDGNEIDVEELWLLEDGTFATTCRSGHESHWQNAWWGWEREPLRPVADPLAASWDVDTIINSIVHQLEKRLAKLGERSKVQQARLEKVKNMMVKE